MRGAWQPVWLLSGLVLTASDGPSLVTGFRPSQNPTFTPLIETSDGG